MSINFTNLPLDSLNQICDLLNTKDKRHVFGLLDKRCHQVALSSIEREIAENLKRQQTFHLLDLNSLPLEEAHLILCVLEMF